ncbi:spermidine synthase [Neptunitalea sp. Y10]|uniref:Spermidine synthase n=2 Tax=Neptunitalea lumnitzerae TaxID=2965509 RepID=A0ABQ5ML98_9FLAO|nr:spermidine synthase [Neptunitalea sp. Y10]
MPVTTNTYESDYSGTIEITMFNGKKMVDTENANYSYGSLQKILNFGLKKIPLQNINSILVLGMGAGSVIDSLRKKFNYQKEITAVEIDPLMITIAKEEFGITNNQNTTILNDDAFKFLEHNKNSFDLVIIDLFIDTEVPDLAYNQNFSNLINNTTAHKGWFIFNAALSHTNKTHAHTLEDYFKKYFHLQFFKKVRGTNTLLIGHKK